MTDNQIILRTEYDELVSLTLRSMPSVNSQRVYGQTLKVWAVWCQEQGLDPLDLRPNIVMDYIEGLNAVRKTKNRVLAALRKLAQIMYVLKPTEDNRRIHEALKLVKPSASPGGQERTKTALTPAQADKTLRFWAEDISPIGLRNHALIAVLLLTGIRRAEAAVLQWSDIDFENGTVFIRHGKGDKSRHVTFAGDLALEALNRWHMTMAQERKYIFCPVLKGGHIGDDRPIRGADVYAVVKQTMESIGMEHVKPHDFRRTLITEKLSTGMAVQEVQADAGHSSGTMTLQYAQSSDARQRRKNIKIRYGG